MGETYYENAEFAAARTIYRELLERYPEKPYTKLVGLRLGDFLRDEGKETDALRIYEQVVKNAPKPVKLRGKLRIANIFAQRPVGEDYKKSLTTYDEVIKEGEKQPVAADALMRKGLTLTLHRRNREAIDTFIELIKSHPDSPFVKQRIVETNLVENLKTLVNKLFEEEKYWEVVKVYSKHRDPYFRNFRYNVTEFQIARAYHYLGLYDEALRRYDAIGKQEPGSIASLLDFQEAAAYADRDDLGKAEESLLKFIRTHPDDRYMTDARMMLGRVYFEGRRYQDALDAYRIIQRDFEKDKDPRLLEALPQVYYQLGNINKELGQLKEAEAGYKAVIDNFHHPIQGDNVPEYVILSQYALGDALFNLGQDSDAIAAYESAAARYPRHDKTPWAKFQIGIIHRRNGRDREALEIFNGLVELAKTKPGELWEILAKENQRDLVNLLGFQDYLKK
jgi:TolA-binding protein